MSMREPYIIAEIGSNLFNWHDHTGCLAMGKAQIEAAKEAGADAVKFQMFTVKELYGPSYPGPESPYALPREWVPALAEKCEGVGIDFMCSAFSVDGYKFIDPFVKMHKVASPEALAEDIMDWVAVGDKPALVSDGCVGPPVYLDNMIPMACVSRYPAEPNDYDLDLYSGKWGLSDHTLGASLAFDAREKGATYFEKHVDFFKGEGLDTPDSPVSVDGNGFGLWAAGIRTCSVSAPPAKKYGRVKKDGGWYRPWPEGE